MPLIEANFWGKVAIYGGCESFREISGPGNINWDEQGDLPNFAKLFKKMFDFNNATLLRDHVLENHNSYLYASKLLSMYEKLLGE